MTIIINRTLSTLDRQSKALKTFTAEAQRSRGVFLFIVPKAL